MSTSPSCPYQHIAYPNPKNVFFTESYTQVLYAMVYALHKKEYTSIVLLGSRNFLRAFFKFENHPLFNFIPASEAIRTFLPVGQLISLPEISKEEFSVARWLQDYDVQIHVFPPAYRVQLYNRDDIICHYIKDSHYMRTRGYLPETDNVYVYKIYASPSYETSVKQDTDSKIITFDWEKALKEGLSEEDLQAISYRMNVKKLYPASKSVLYIYDEPEGLSAGAINLLRYHTVKLIHDLASDGWEVWFKGREDGLWAPINQADVKILPPYIPHQYYLTHCLPDSQFTHVINFAQSEPVISSGKSVIPWDTKKTLTLYGYLLTEAGGIRAYKKGLLRVARALLTSQDMLRLWESWCR